MVGSRDCLENGATGNESAPGNPLTAGLRTVCIGGIVYSFPSIIYVSFSITHEPRFFTYFGDVPLTLVEADCEARYEGPGGPSGTTAIVRVTEGPGGTLRTNFYLCETIYYVMECCGPVKIPGTLRMVDLYIEGRHFTTPPTPPEWSITAPLLEITYHATAPIGAFPWPVDGGWVAFVKCDGTQGTEDDFGFMVLFTCTGIAGFKTWHLYLYKPDGSILYTQNSLPASGGTCSPFDIAFELRTGDRYTTPLCGNSVLDHTVKVSYEVLQPL